MTHNGNRKSQLPPDAAGNGKAHPDRTASGTSNHDARGRFTKGNKVGRGNPYARRVAVLRRAMLRIVKPNDLQTIIVKMILRGCAGDVAAARLALQYTLGKPSETVDPDRVDLEELELTEERLAFNPALVESLHEMPPGMASNLGGVLLNCFEEVMPKLFGKMFKEANAQLDAEQAAEQPAQAPGPSAPPAQPEREEPDERKSKERVSQPPRPVTRQERLERLVGVLLQLKPEGLTDSVENGGAPAGVAARDRGAARVESAIERRMPGNSRHSTVNKRFNRCEPNGADDPGGRGPD
jgi:hypothetical protein